MTVLETILEILKYTVPALIMYLLMRQHLRSQIYMEELKRKTQIKNDTLNLRLQAYERITLFCERIRLSNLVVRLMSEGMEVSQLKNSLLISVQKEFEHNISQQIYLSSSLWEMIQLYKDEVLATITTQFVKNERSSIENYTRDLLSLDSSLEENFGKKVRAAVRKEVSLYFQ